jgi:SAM-dependent methyltransferase
MPDPIDDTRRSWNAATRNHNAHKGDQAAFLRDGSTLFDEELAALGDVHGARIVHMQCNAGQDTLSLAKLGADVTGVDLSDEAIAFARQLSHDSGIAARFEQGELLRWLDGDRGPFDVAFCSYGALGWLPDLGRWARGVERLLAPGGRLVIVEFHPVAWSIGASLRLDGDDYFRREPFVEPVGDYVAASGAGLLAVAVGETRANDIPAWSYQHGLGTIVTAVASAGLVIEQLVEHPHSNGCKLIDALVPAEGRRFVWPEGAARVPLMYSLVARRADAAGAAMDRAR